MIAPDAGTLQNAPPAPPAALVSEAARQAKPRFRGSSHLFGFFTVLGAAPVLFAFAPSFRASVGAAIYGLSLMAMLGVSALYHRTNPSVRVEKWLERMDHGMIFIFIGGSYTPFCLLLPPETGNVMLLLAWSGVALGVLQSLFWVDAPDWIAVALYLLVGWSVLPFVGQLWGLLGPTGLILLVAGGVLYTLGAVVFARKRPDPWPETFGFHEIFHVFVLVACVIHFVAVATAVQRTVG